MKPILIEAGRFKGWAIEEHTSAVRMPSGSTVTRRNRFGDLLYRYGYKGERELLAEISSLYAAAIQGLFGGDRSLDLLVMVPPPVSSPRYQRTVALTPELSKASGIASAQFAVKSEEAGFDPVRHIRGKRSFSFSAPAAAGFFSGKRVLVIDDLFRTGNSIREFCTLLSETGKAAEIKLLVGTKT